MIFFTHDTERMTRQDEQRNELRNWLQFTLAVIGETEGHQP